MKSPFLIIAFFIIHCGYSQTTWYIATTGSNTNTGLTVDEAFETTNFAINLAECGDSIYILAGTYHEKINAYPICPENNRITVQGDIIERPLIIGDSTVLNKYAIGASGSGFRFRHLELTSPYPDLCSQQTMVIVGKGSYFDFINVIVHHGGYDGIKTVADCGTSAFPIGWRIIDSEVHSNGLGCPAEIVNGDGIDFTECRNCLIENSIIRDNMGHQIQIKLEARNVTVQNSHIEGIHLFQIGLPGGTPQCDLDAFNADSIYIRYNTMLAKGDTSEFVIKMADVNNIYIENNTIIKDDAVMVDVGFICFGGCGSDPDWEHIPQAPAFVRNNIFYSRASLPFYAGPDTTFFDPLGALESEVICSHNLFYDLHGEYITPPDGSPSSLVTDPLLCDFPAGYELSDESPCIDTGDPTSPDDPDGSRNDMGARFYQTPCLLSTGLPTTIQNWQIYPNPGSDLIHIKTDQPLKGTEIQIRNLQGQLVLSMPYTNQFNLASLENGIYFVHLFSEKGRVQDAIKFLKTN